MMMTSLAASKRYKAKTKMYDWYLNMSGQPHDSLGNEQLKIKAK